MGALKEYQKMIAEVDRRCHQIVRRHADRIACAKGCAGNCCRIHLSVYSVEAVSLVLALQKLAPDMRRRIQNRARHTSSFGPCPLLEDGACLMYDARAVICRSHGLPTRTEYKGSRTVGACVKNFKNTTPIPEEDIIDLAQLNSALVEINVRFLRENSLLRLPDKRCTIAEALFIDFLSCNLQALTSKSNI